MLEWFVTPVINKLIDACFAYLKDSIRWQTGMKEALQRLRHIHPKIQAFVSAYSQAQIDDQVLNKWLWQLRDAVDEADDVLDDLKYMEHEKQVSNDEESAVKEGSVFKRLDEAVLKLDKISAEVRNFQHLLESRRKEKLKQQLEIRKKRETGSIPNNNILIGRSKEMEFVKQWLRNPYQTEITNTDIYRNISLLSIVGHAGMGKTNLLQHVFKDEMTKEFGVKMWVWVSHKFDGKTVIKHILQYLKRKTCEMESLATLQINLQSEVMSKKFLLVMDDIWEDDETEWWKVLAPLRYGSLGSKILITTRMDSIAVMFSKMIEKPKEILPLKGLEEPELLKLFRTYAFFDVETPNYKFELIGEKIAEGLLECPFDKCYWKNIINTDIGSMKSEQNYFLSNLNLSFMHLPNFLRGCFSFCCIFPRHHEFDKNDLVRMWIALDLVQPSDIQGVTMEDTGRRYFNILVQNYFFDEFRTDDDRLYYKMHGLIYELAQYVSIKECFRVTADKELSIPETIRHLSVNTYSLEVFRKIGELKILRSLFLFLSSDGAKYDEEAFSEIFSASKNIRLLFISALKIQWIPDSISSLTHLRYLKLDRCILKNTSSISCLYHLQF